MDINATLFGQFLTFLILIGFTMRYVWPPITHMLKTRERKISEGLEAAARGKRELEVAAVQVQAMIRDARSQASVILDQANAHASQIVEAAKESARQESARLLQSAQTDIAREVEQARESLRVQLTELAIAGAERILRQELNHDMQKNVLRDLANRL